MRSPPALARVPHRVGRRRPVPSLRLSGLYFVIVTVIVANLAIKLNIYFSEWTGGENGYLQVPSLMAEIDQFIPAGVESSIVQYYIAVLLLLAICAMLLVLAKSQLGIVLGSMKQDEVLLESIGFDPVKYRLVGFGITSLLVGFAASIWTHVVTSLNPQSHLAFAQMIDIIIAVVLGGTGTIVGPVIGVFALALFDELLSFLSTNYGLFASLGIDLPVLRRLITMVLVFFFIYYLPDGVYPKIKFGVRRLSREGLISLARAPFEQPQTEQSKHEERSD